uniref:Hypothethical protein n=1 Tax=Steinernema glaseri TaxID=37863 RepID=A0A1I7ZV46_9BILA
MMTTTTSTVDEDYVAAATALHNAHRLTNVTNRARRQLASGRVAALLCMPVSSRRISRRGQHAADDGSRPLLVRSR